MKQSELLKIDSMLLQIDNINDIDEKNVTNVRGILTFYHYNCDGKNDSGWGCGYRTLQTICSWIINVKKLQSTTDVPSIDRIQEVLVKIEDKPRSFIRSQQWIGTCEVAMALSELYDVDCKLIHVPSGDDLCQYMELLVKHFQDFGSPIMMGGDADAASKCIIAVRSSKQFLILDPHYSGSHFTSINQLRQSALNNHLKTKSTTKISSTNHSMCQIATKISSEGNGTHKMSPNGYSITLNNDDQHHNDHHLSNERNVPIEIDSNTKCLVAIYLAALHLRQRMREENLIHPSYSAYLNGENNPRSLFHNCFHSYETIEWLKKQQLCKTSTDGLEIFQVLEKLLIIHHVCDLNQFEYPASGSISTSTIRYLYRFRLDDGTTDQNRSFQEFASIYETYTSLFTLDKNQCRGIDLQQQMPLASPYDEQPGITLKGDNLARMIALRSGANMLHVEHIADNMIMYGLVRFDQCDQDDPCDCYCTTKFHSDSHHQYVLSNTHRLSSNKRLDLIALMQPDLFSSLMIHYSPVLKRSETSPFVSVSCPDRSPCFSNFQHKLTFNRTLSNYHYHDSSKKPSPSFSSNNCDQCPCSRLSSPLARAFVSPSRISNDGRRNQLPRANGSDACLADDERQHHRYISHGDALECTTQLTCTVNNNDGSRRRKSASLNSPASIENRPTAEDLEKLELPWRWRSFSLKRDRRGYGLILQGQGPCYVERLDPYGSAYTSGIRVNEYIYAVEGVNVLRRSGKEVERLLSMFDKCTVYTVYNRDDHHQLATPPNELHTNRVYSIKQSMSFLSPLPNDYNNNSTNNLLTTVASTINDSSCPIASGKLTSCSSSPQQQQNSSPSSSIDGISSCSISPKQSLTTSLNKKRTFSKPFSFFKFNGRSSNSTTPSADGPK